ncbi:Uncharacterised protein [Mycobacteroides abscessus subsp. abscessus]|nr:Uncharacterised protein [Mycobacteroides abscessus subsp. abscessus]
MASRPLTASTRETNRPSASKVAAIVPLSSRNPPGAGVGVTGRGRSATDAPSAGTPSRACGAALKTSFRAPVPAKAPVAASITA